MFIKEDYMKILVVNAGSSSLKYQVIDIENEECLLSGGIERIGEELSTITHEIINPAQKHIETHKFDNHTEALKVMFDLLENKDFGLFKNISEIDAVGHRVLHTGVDFTGSVVISDETLTIMEKNVPLGPLHMPANLDCIKSCAKFLPGVPMVAVFDTAFHITMPKHAYMYAIPYEDYEKYKVRRYGFHGTSHKYVTDIAIEMLGCEHSRIINCHLGNGASISAVKDGKCQDTSMGLTPLEGLIMGTRSGDIDPACLEYLMDKKGFDIHQMLNYLNKESGFKGVSGVGSDGREVQKAAESGNERAQLVLDMSAYRVKKYIGSYAAVLGGVDCIVFTGGIGENSNETRERILTGLEYLGLEMDWDLNKNCPSKQNVEISKPGSKVKVFVIPTNEELVIARETRDLI